jgi:hypothetical protein
MAQAFSHPKSCAAGAAGADKTRLLFPLMEPKIFLGVVFRQAGISKANRTVYVKTITQQARQSGCGFLCLGTGPGGENMQVFRAGTVLILVEPPFVKAVCSPEH